MSIIESSPLKSSAIFSASAKIHQFHHLKIFKKKIRFLYLLSDFSYFSGCLILKLAFLFGEKYRRTKNLPSQSPVNLVFLALNLSGASIPSPFSLFLNCSAPSLLFPLEICKINSEQSENFLTPYFLSSAFNRLT